jgi:rhodanese-related sulfurtransferase
MNELHPPQALEKIEKEGYLYLDVRTEEEFAAGHAPGAYNVPVMFRGPVQQGMNPDFEAVVEKHFPKDTPLVVGCAAGGRSARAIEMLNAMGYTNLINLACGFSGNPATGEPGWKDSGLPVSEKPSEGRSYGELQA